MSKKDRDKSARKQLAIIKDGYWEKKKSQYVNGKITLGEIVRGFLGYLVKELDVVVYPVVGRIEHPSDDPRRTNPSKIRGLAALDTSGGKKNVFVNGKTPESRRFALAHEIVHVLRGDLGLQHRTDGSNERNVESLAAEILMPKIYVRQIFKERFGEPIFAHPSDEAVRRLFANANRDIPRGISGKDFAITVSQLASRAIWFGGPSRFRPMHEECGVSIAAMWRRLIELRLVLETPASKKPVIKLVASPSSSDLHVTISAAIPHKIDKNAPSDSRECLSREQEERLVAAISDFMVWLNSTMGIEASHKYKIEFSGPSEADWIMESRDPNILKFNTHLLTKCGLPFYELVVLHESFHAIVQAVPNKSDVTDLKDDFGELFMRFLDVEADYYAARFLKEQRGATLTDILRLYREGDQIFGGTSIRRIKFERFVGSMLSIVNIFAPRSDSPQKSDCDRFLPAIANVQIDQRMQVFVIHKSFMSKYQVSINYDDLEAAKSCYANSQALSVREYIRRIINFSCKGLGHSEVPACIKSEIDRL